MLFLGLITGLLVGVVAGWLARSRLQNFLRQRPPFIPASISDAIGSDPIEDRIAAAIAEIERQMRQGIDGSRNATRLQILREVKDGD